MSDNFDNNGSNYDQNGMGYNQDNNGYNQNNAGYNQYGASGYDQNNVNYNQYGNGYDPNQTPNDYVTGVEKAPKKKTGLKVAAIGAGAAVVIAGGGVAAYNLSDYVKNQVKLATLEPAEYYAWVNEKTAEEAAENISKTYQEVLDKSEKGQSASFSIKYELSSEVKDLLLAEAGDDEEIVDIIENIDSIEIGADSDVKKTEMLETVYASVNDEKLVSAEVAMDMENLACFMRIPELKEQWVGMELGELMAEEISAEGTVAENLYDACMDAMVNPEDYISPEDLSDLITRYTAVWNGAIEDVELEKKQEVEISDLTVEYTVITAEIDEEKAYDIMEAFVKEAADDDIIKDLVTEKIGAVSEDEYDEAFDDLLEEIDTMKEESDFSDDTTIDLITYVDATGTIRGFEFVMNGEDEEMSARFIVGADKDNIAAELVMNDNGVDVISVTLDGTREDKAYSGEIECTVVDESEEYYDDYDYDDEYYYEGEEEEEEEEEEPETEETTITIEFNDFEIVDEEKGYINCGLAVILPDIDEPISLDFSSDGKSQDITYDINIEDTDYGKLVLSMSAEDSADVSIPSSDDAFMIDLESEDIAIEDYVAQEDVQAFIEELLKKLGFSDEDAASAAESAAAEIYAADDYYEDDYYEDDFYEDDFYEDDFYEDDFYEDDFYEDDFYEDDYYEDDFYEDDFYEDDYYEDDFYNTDNPDAANSVAAEPMQAYLNVMDYYWDAEYWGMQGDNLSYNAKVADITGNGQYTISVTADTDGYRYDTTGSVDDVSAPPYGLDYLSVAIDDIISNYPDVVITIDSVKIDGVEMPITGSTYTDTGVFTTEGIIYCEWYGEPSEDAKISDGNPDNASTVAIDGASVEEWYTIEVTFTVSGM